MESIVLILGAIQEHSSLAIKWYFAIPSEDFILLIEPVDLFLLLVIKESFEVYFADVTEKEIVESPDVGVGTFSDDIGCCIVVY